MVGSTGQLSRRRMPSPKDDPIENQIDEALLDFLRRCDANEPTDRETFLRQYPSIAPQLRELLEAADRIELMAGPTAASDDSPPTSSSEETVQFIGTHQVVSLSNPGEPSRRRIRRPQRASRHQTRMRMPPGPPIAPRAVTSDRSMQSSGGRKPRKHPARSPCRFGDYILQKILGRGGMGVVYLAQQVQLERRVAIKMIRSGCFAGEKRFSDSTPKPEAPRDLTIPISWPFISAARSRVIITFRWTTSRLGFWPNGSPTARWHHATRRDV